jgi:hypothetical protein
MPSHQDRATMFKALLAAFRRLPANTRTAIAADPEQHRLIAEATAFCDKVETKNRQRGQKQARKRRLQRRAAEQRRGEIRKLHRKGVRLDDRLVEFFGPGATDD